MDFSKTLLLKGLGGIAAVGTVGGGVVFGRNMLLKNQEERDKVREEINGKLKTLGLGEDCRLGKEDDPYTINKECDLDEGKLKKIKFSNKGDGDLVVKSSSGAFPEGLKLKFERKNKEEDISFSFTGLTEGSEIKVFGDKSKGKIVIKNAGEGIKKFKEKEEKLEKDSSGVEEALKTKLEGFNKQLETVNAPIECRFDELESEESVECPISEGELKTLKFSGLGDGDLTVKTWPSSGAENIKLKVERKDKENISLSFTGLGQDLAIYGDKSKGKIVLKSTPESKFKVKEGKLSKGDSNADLKKFNEQLGTINAPIECRFDEAESEASVECNISENDLKGMKFSNKEGDGELKIVGWPTGSGTIKLKAERDSAAQNEMSVSFTGVTSDIKVFGDKTKGKIIIKSDGEGNKKFKVEDGKLTKGTSDADLKKFNGQLEKVNAPLECRFDETETEGSFECDVTSEDLKTMVFTKDKKELTYSSGQGFTGMKLKVQVIKKVGSNADEKTNEVLLTFKDYSETVKLTYKEEKKDKNISLVKGANPEFVIHEENVEGNTSAFLIREWGSDDFENLLGLTCALPEDGTQTDCSFDKKAGGGGEEKKIKVAKGTGDEFEELTVDDTNGNKFVLHKDVEGYNQGFKFAYSGTKVTASGSDVCIEPNSNYEFKWKIQEEKTKTGYLVKKEGAK